MLHTSQMKQENQTHNINNMKKRKYLSVLKFPYYKITWFFRRSIVLYAVVFLLLIPVFNHGRALDIAKRRALNRVIPLMGQLVEFINRGGGLTQKELREYLAYYKTVDAYIPGRDDAKAMMGFCYYYMGNDKKALSAYKRSVDLNPYFFWSHYNLGVIHLQNRHYGQAAEFFRKAIAIKPQVTLKIISSSKLYREILSGIDNPRDVIGRNLKQGYRHCYRMLQKAEALRQAPGSSASFKEGDKIHLRIF